jgi:hypothetical protein
MANWTEPARALEEFEVWLARQPLAERSAREYLRNVRAFCVCWRRRRTAKGGRQIRSPIRSPAITRSGTSGDTIGELADLGVPLTQAELAAEYAADRATLEEALERYRAQRDSKISIGRLRITLRSLRSFRSLGRRATQSFRSRSMSLKPNWRDTRQPEGSAVAKTSRERPFLWGRGISGLTPLTTRGAIWCTRRRFRQ